jgi:hypothetical protein
VKYGHRAALGALVVAFALLFFAEGAALPTAWLPIEEAAVLVHARDGGGTHSGSGILYPAVLAPVARSVSPPSAYRFAKALSAVLWALVAIPAYLLARRLVSPRASLAVAALAVVAPAAVYATAAVPDGLALLLAISSLPLLARASERGSRRDLLGALALATAAAVTRPWFVVLPIALLVAYELPRSSRDSFLRWPRALVFAGFAAFGYFVLAATAPEVGHALTSPGAIARAATASLVVAVVGVGVIPWLLVAAGGRSSTSRPETALLVTCLPALALSAGVFGAAQSGAQVEERPLLVLVPLVLALAAAAWLGRVSRLSSAAPAGAAVVLGAFALPTLGRVPVAHAAGLAVVVANGGSKGFVVAGVAAAVVVAFVGAVLLRRHPFALPAVVAVLLLVGHAAAWSSVHREARALAASEPTPRDWVDRHAGSGSRVFVVGPPTSVDQRFVAQLTLWNRSVRGFRQLDLSKVDVQTGLLPNSGPDLALVRGPGIVGSSEIARSAAGVLVKPPLGIAQTIDGLYPDGWSGDHAYYRRFSGPPKPGTVLVVVSRVAWGGQDKPADVRIDSEPLNGTATQAAHIVIHAGKEYKLVIPVPPPPFQIAMTIQPTFSPSEFGGTDTRPLGAQITFTYRPGK